MSDSRGFDEDLIAQLANFWRRAKQPDIGHAIRLLREQLYSRRFFVDRMGEVSGQVIRADDSLVYRWEKGITSPSPYYRPILNSVCIAQLNQMSIKGRREFLTQMAAFNGGLLTLSPAVETGSPIAFPLDLEQLTSAGANPQHLDDNLIESLHSMTRILAGQRHTLPLNTLLGPMLAHKEHVASFFKSANSEPIQRSLGLALSEASIATSRLFSWADHEKSATNCAFAQDLAFRLNDPILEATALVFQANLLYDSSDIQNQPKNLLAGLLMLSQAAEKGRLLPPSLRARIEAERARTYGALGLRDECTAAIDRARRASEEITEKDRIGLFSDWRPTRLSVYEGTCWLLLGNPKMAVKALEQGVPTFESKGPNLALFAQIDLGSAYAESQELEEGSRLLGYAFTELAKMGNTRGTRRIQHARSRLEPWRDEPAVRDLDERINSGLTALTN